jgi:adenylate cyclase
VTESRWRSGAVRLLAIAEDGTEDDDARLRKRVGVAAGIVTIFAPFGVPPEANWHPFSVVIAVALSVFALVNLAVLARTKRFERYVNLLLSAGVVFVPAATILGGGISGATGGLVFAFLGPAYAIMALGPRAALRWFAAFIAVVAVMVVLDPIARQFATPAPTGLALAGQVMNALVPLTVIFLLLRYTDVRRRVAEARVDALLTNAIPGPIAARLKRGETRIAETYPETTVVFTDLAGFTPWVASADPARVVDLLDDLFSRFDELASRHGMEKIKTVGDSYMAVAGAPVAMTDHARAATAFARDTLHAAEAWRNEHGVEIGLRVGVASGPVVAGVIGAQRILFDLWGATVNLAARMESSGVPGAVQLAPSTVALLGNGSEFERREVDVKGIGRVEAYLAR